jgi:hypothetical protein
LKKIEPGGFDQRREIDSGRPMVPVNSGAGRGTTPERVATAPPSPGSFFFE